MNILSSPIELIGRGGASSVSGALLLAVEFLIALLFILAVRRLAIFSGAKKERVTGRVTRKWVIPEHHEWQGKAYVTVPATNALEIVVENHSLQFSPPPWKYDRVHEGDDVDVTLQRGRFGNEMRILEIGPF
jgi:hypothetical protein